MHKFIPCFIKVDQKHALDCQFNHLNHKMMCSHVKY